MSRTISSPSHRGTHHQRKSDSQYELTVLMGIADNEGWSDEKFTEALKRLAAEKKSISSVSQTSTVEVVAEPLQPCDGANTHMNWTPWYLCGSMDELVRTEKRQETARINRQADRDGWSDDKTLAALRLRNCVHYELRGKRMQTQPITSEF
ncbi:hypothetical protein VPNG_10036 [Cytospora leucostoma]|uniref:Uncharacterized protein n=1 Tax=Cytospora leucostoma TaxID=1230097 RepID=A0A423VH90_9PEZI|nr:hypothetical protein VPNG_10036 [Cytospora leucostoma]